MPTPGTRTMFDEAFKEAVAEARKHAASREDIPGVLESWWMDGDWPTIALGEQLNTLDELLGTGVFEQSIERLRQQTEWLEELLTRA